LDRQGAGRESDGRHFAGCAREDEAVITVVPGKARTAGDGPSLAELAYRQIHRKIIRCELRPGSEVTQGELTEATGLGRSPVREALARLAADGLVISRPRFGYQVSPITLTDIREIFGLRAVVESAAAELACERLDETALDRLDALCAPPSPADTVEAIMERNREFHLLIGRSAGNLRLAEVIERLVSESERFIFYQVQSGYPVQHVPVEHHRLAGVLRARDGAQAARLAAEDAGSTAQNLIDLIVSSAGSGHLIVSAEEPGGGKAARHGT
jgi:DNA-binding GntR family transcriptional regulator